MTKGELEQLIHLRKEIKEIENKMRREDTTSPSGNIELLERRKYMAAQREKEITEYINSIIDSRVRRIMQFKYVEGYTWEKIANIMHYDKSYPEKVITRYLHKHVD